MKRSIIEILKLELIVLACTEAPKAHAAANHTYNGHPYSLHLSEVFRYGIKYNHLLPEDEIGIVLASCCTHDLIEDTRATYNDVKSIYGERVAEITYAMTNEKGKNRAERANDKYYEGIRNVPFATFVKLCDRLANVSYSILTSGKDSGMAKKYKKEHANFKKQLYDQRYKEMFDELDQLLA